MRKLRLLGISVLLMSGCYHATINTGVAAGPRQVHRLWALSFVDRLVPPPTVKAIAERGDAGVARVETQHSFLNMVVASVTFGIVTPMDILVTGGSKPGEDLQTATTRAEVDKALAGGKPFLVKVP